MEEVIPPCANDSCAPKYDDIGKTANDLLSKGYDYGFLKGILKMSPVNGLKLKATGQYCVESRNISGNIETEHKCQHLGATLVEKWTSENVVSAEVTAEDKIGEGSKLGLEMIYAPLTGSLKAKLKSMFRNENLNICCDVDLTSSGQKIISSGVVRHLGYMFGCQMCYDTEHRNTIKNNLALGYSDSNFQFTNKVNDFTDYRGSLYHKISRVHQIGLLYTWSTSTNVGTFGIGSKYAFDDDSTLNVKINNVGQLGLAYAIQVQQGLKFTLSSLIECTRLSEGGHKFGLCVEFEPK